ncbi:MAG: hypothetical protein ABS87_06560 [Sphingomonas sp. SCN 67-18]|nr:TadE/TadG family type IV pilus assembly protein [Sphingomonas sp. SCN 67-18]ODU21486.1 MAG: hypothetical protein ABS87_06560 [Sphingomonas sp. SCN 67-18]
MSRAQTIFPQLRSDKRGATAIEFGVVAPVLILTLLGLSDLGYRVYAQSILDGAMQKSGRDSTLETNVTTDAGAELDAQVAKAVRTIAPNATFETSRKSYAEFGRIRREDYPDANGNGVRDVGECFEDLNGNGKQDDDPGKVGQGGADDVVVYDVTVTYPRLFPLGKIMGWPAKQVIKGRTILKNQPYNSQNIPPIKVICT